MSIGRLDLLPRVRLAALPTPLEELTGLTRLLGGPRILVKREDLTGFAFGGSKVRKLEMLLGQAQAEGADTLVVSGDYQSNLSRMVAAAGARLGMRSVLVLGGDEHESREAQGNLLLDLLAGAEIRWFTGDFRTGHAESLKVAEELRAEGCRPYVVPLGGSGPVGASGYVEAVGEMLQQCASVGAQPTALVVPVGSGGTMAGLVLGNKVHGSPFDVVGISTSRPTEYLREHVSGLANQAAEWLGLSEVQVEPDEIEAYDQYLGGGFGVLSSEARDAIFRVAGSEGLFLDPVYTAKTAVGLADLIGSGRFTAEDTVVFLHSGGLPALFAYAPVLVQSETPHPSAPFPREAGDSITGGALLPPPPL